jgi:hypothetical protein
MPKRGKYNPHSGNKQAEGEEKSTNRHVYVEPGVQIDLVQDLKKTYQSSQTDSTTHGNKQLFWTKISAGLLFLVALIYCGQLYQMIDQNRLTRESFKAVQGAVVSFSAPQIKVTPYADKRFPFYMFVTPFTNGGDTATKTGRVYWSVLKPPESEPIPDNYTFPDQGTGNGGTFALGPKQTAYTKPIAIEDGIVQDMLARRTRIYFYGWAAYRDRFEDTPDRVTEFCYEFWNIIKTGENMEGQVNVCQHHNCYDDECPDYKERIKAIR